MANQRAKSVTGRSTMATTAANARCVNIAKRGVRTGSDFANFMSGLMSDLIEGKVPPQVGNAVCNAGGKLLKIVEMRYKYGSPVLRKNATSPPVRELSLAAGRSA